MKKKTDLEKKIREILLKDWDPIGIQHISGTDDEYDSYISPIYQLISSRKSESEIFNYLWWIETEYMGLTGNSAHTKIIAKKISNLI